MDKDKDSAHAFPSQSLILIVMLGAGALVWRNAPLESSRPALPEPRADVRRAAQDVDARMWQDPFGAVSKAREEARKRGPDAAQGGLKHDAAELGALLQDRMRREGAAGAAVLAVSLPGGPYAEQVEARRRMRYAVLAALNAGDFVPDDNDHLGYWVAPQQERAWLPEVVPFELFMPAPRLGPRQQKAPPHAPRPVLVLWLDSDDMERYPLQSLRRLVGALDAQARMGWHVLGPASSDGLGALLGEVARHDAGDGPLLPEGLNLRLYSPSATVPDDELLSQAFPDSPEVAGQRVSEVLEKHGIHVYRTIGDDRRLAQALITELGLRGLRNQASTDDFDPQQCFLPMEGTGAKSWDGPSHVAIVSDWDTVYGRTLFKHFRIAATSGHPGYCVRRYSYMRGLDGRLPGDTVPTAAAPAAKDRAAKDDAITRDGEYIERPEGQSQYDYLRRLAQRLSAEDQRLRRMHPGSGGIRAVGVLGNDVYDKLLVMQALRAQLPHALFFTTDLDARLLHPRELPWSRNLVVASNFGLQLTPGWQLSTPPFRDSYQTGLYLSAQWALEDVRHRPRPQPQALETQQLIDRWFARPRIFEVSRAGAFEFEPALVAGTDAAADAAPARPVPASEPAAAPASAVALKTALGEAAGAARPAPAAAAAGRGSDYCYKNWSIRDCPDIHPRPPGLAASPSWAALFLAALGTVLTLWMPPALLQAARRRDPTLARARPPAAPPSRRASFTAWVLALALSMLAAAALAWLWPGVASWLTEAGAGKPLSFTLGISAWPMHALRLFALLLCGFLLWASCTALRNNLDRITHEFRLGPSRHELEECLRTLGRRHPARQFLAMFTLHHYGSAAGLARHLGLSPGAADFWLEYALRSRTAARMARTLLGTLGLLLLLLAWLLQEALQPVGVAPQRGLRWTWLDPALGLGTLVMLQLLVCFVVDATLTNVFFMRGLREHELNWPSATVQHFTQQLGIEAPKLKDIQASKVEDWIDLHFISRRTDCIGPLVYGPFVVMSLLLMARSAWFDQWSGDPVLMALLLLDALLLIASVFALRRTAEASRAAALRRMREAIDLSRDAALQERLQRLRERMQELQGGAFSPFWRQPLLKALLLPFATMGGTTLLETMALLNV